MALENVNKSRLQELSGSDYEIADGQPDIRGWDVRDENSKRIGKVKELLFDESSRKVRYIILNLKDNDYDLEARKVLVPIGIASLHENDDDVILPGITISQLQQLPEYEKDSFSPESETGVRNVFAGVGGAALAGSAAAVPLHGSDEFYNHDHFNEDNLYRNRTGDSKTAETLPVIEEQLQVGKREVKTGGIRLRSRIFETPVQEDIRLREEKVRVVTTPVDRAADSTDLKEENIELTERSEVPVVSKEARIVEEVSLHKDVNEREITINDTVRNTEVEIERTDEDGSTSKGTGV